MIEAIKKLIVQEERYDEEYDDFDYDEEYDEEYEEEREPEKIESDYLDLTKLGFNREEDLDFEDDGSYFHIFSYGNVRVSCLVARGELYLTIHDVKRPSNVSEAQLHYFQKKYDNWDLNGVSLESVTEKDLIKFKNLVFAYNTAIENCGLNKQPKEFNKTKPMDKLIIKKKKVFDEKTNSFVAQPNEFEIKRVITVDGKEVKSLVATYNSKKDTISLNPVETVLTRKELNEINKLVYWASHNLHKKHDNEMSK